MRGVYPSCTNDGTHTGIPRKSAQILGNLKMPRNDLSFVSILIVSHKYIHNSRIIT